MTAKAGAENDDARQIFAGRIDVLYSLGRHYLSLPFAVLCVPATILAGHGLGFLPLAPLLLQMAVVIAAGQLTSAYHHRPVGSDPQFWARRYTWISATGFPAASRRPARAKSLRASSNGHALAASACSRR